MKRIFCALLASILLLAGCAAPQDSPSSSAAELPAENMVIDGAGTALSLPEDPANATIASVYAVCVPFLAALEVTDQVKAINVKSKFWTDVDEHLDAAGSVGRGTVDLEALAEVAPYVLIHRSNDEQTVSAVQDKLGIDVMCITVESFDDIQNTLTMMGEYFGKQQRAQEVCDWLDGKFAMIADIVAQIPQEERVSALAMGGELGRVAGGDMLQSWMIEQAGGISVSSEAANERNWIDVGVETVFAWNPDVLFCTSSTVLDYTVENVLADPVWSEVQAVKDNSVYLLPAKIDSWDMPGISCAIGTMYMTGFLLPSLSTGHNDYFVNSSSIAESFQVPYRSVF